jgi:hypothetical protein
LLVSYSDFLFNETDRAKDQDCVRILDLYSVLALRIRYGSGCRSFDQYINAGYAVTFFVADFSTDVHRLSRFGISIFVCRVSADRK